MCYDTYDTATTLQRDDNQTLFMSYASSGVSECAATLTTLLRHFSETITSLVFMSRTSSGVSECASAESYHYQSLPGDLERMFFKLR